MDSSSRTTDAGQQIAAGISVETTLRVFRDSVNKPHTIFSTDHWLSPKLDRLRELLSEPITADQAEALLDVLYQRHWMGELIEWLESPPIAWQDFFKYPERQEAEEAYEAPPLRLPWDVFGQGPREQPQSCPDCGSKRIVSIMYGFPSKEGFEAARRGEIVLGGCIMDDGPGWHCKDCFNSWPDRPKRRQLSGTPESQRRQLREAAAEWASLNKEAQAEPSANEPSIINYWAREDGRRVFLIKMTSGEKIRMEKLLYLHPYGGPPVYEITHGIFFDEPQRHAATLAARRFELGLPS